MDQFWNAFIPLFVALDAIGLLPVFWGLAHRLEPAQRHRAATEAAFTALLAAIGFLLVSRYVFELMGLVLADVMVAGGAILIALCLRDLLWSEAPKPGSHPSPGVVPLGVPLLTGPAVLTTVLLVRDRYGWQVTLASLFLNMILVWVMLRSSDWFMRRLGREGAEALSKVFSVVLTAFGVMLIRHGVELMMAPPPQ